MDLPIACGRQVSLPATCSNRFDNGWQRASNPRPQALAALLRADAVLDEERHVQRQAIPKGF